MVYFEYFSANSVFASGALNAFFNRLYTYAVNAFGEEAALANLFFDGRIALELQGAKPFGATDYIELSCSSDKLFRLMIPALPALGVSEIAQAGNTYTVKAGDFVFVLQPSAAATVVLIDNIPCRDKNTF